MAFNFLLFTEFGPTAQCAIYRHMEDTVVCTSHSQKPHIFDVDDEGCRRLCVNVCRASLAAAARVRIPTPSGAHPPQHHTRDISDRSMPHVCVAVGLSLRMTIGTAHRHRNHRHRAPGGDAGIAAVYTIHSSSINIRRNWYPYDSALVCRVSCSLSLTRTPHSVEGEEPLFLLQRKTVCGLHTLMTH